MSAPRIMSLCHLSAKNHQNWWKFDKVLTKAILHSIFETCCSFHTINDTSSQFNSNYLQCIMMIGKWGRCKQVQSIAGAQT